MHTGTMMQLLEQWTFNRDNVCWIPSLPCQTLGNTSPSTLLQIIQLHEYFAVDTDGYFKV